MRSARAADVRRDAPGLVAAQQVPTGAWAQPEGLNLPPTIEAAALTRPDHEFPVTFDDVVSCDTDGTGKA
jgi:hypothetical protein